MANAPSSKTSSGLSPTRSPRMEEVAKNDQLLVDEALIESFPASDPPAWTSTHAGTPRSRPTDTETPRELRSKLRNVVEQLPNELSRRADFIASAFLETGCHIVRIPNPSRPGMETLEAVLRGSEDGEELVIAGRYDDNPAALAALIGLACVLAGRRFRRSIRLVASSEGGAGGYVKRLREHAIHLRGALCLDSVGFLTDRHVPRTSLARLAAALVPWWTGTFVAFVGARSSRALLDAVTGAFARGTRLEVQKHVMPGRLPLLASSDSHAFTRYGYPSAVVTDTGPLRNLARSRAKNPALGLNYDAIADLVFGLSCVVATMGEGEAA